MSADSPLVDWTNDEAVCRAAVPDIRLVSDAHDLVQTFSMALGRSLNSGYFGRHIPAAMWKDARRDKRVVDFEKYHEKANNPAMQSPSTEAGEAWTPGPWRFGNSSSVNHNIYAGHLLICGFILKQPRGLGQPRSEDYPNAHLIAAAPELYEALKWLVKHCDMHHSDIVGVTTKAHLVLAKARGSNG